MNIKVCKQSKTTTDIFAPSSYSWTVLRNICTAVPWQFTQLGAWHQPAQSLSFGPCDCMHSWCCVASTTEECWSPLRSSTLCMSALKRSFAHFVIKLTFITCSFFPLTCTLPFIIKWFDDDLVSYSYQTKYSELNHFHKVTSAIHWLWATEQQGRIQSTFTWGLHSVNSDGDQDFPSIQHYWHDHHCILQACL